ncbi:MAG: type II and III secretion system protein [Elusimicrobia bacterium]|nr:type II and III secretion system protein [Elusimicrobiota bacterium]
MNLLPILLALSWAAPAGAEDLIAVSADIVEISGSLEGQRGFSWNEILEFGETVIPGIIKVGELQRKTQLQSTLRFLETEGKAQLLSNPRVIAKSGASANFVVGGEIPFPVVNVQGVGVEFKKFGVILNILPNLVDKKKELINAQIQLEVSNPDFSKPLVIQNVAVPSLVTRQAQTEVALKGGETLVIGGLKRSERTKTKRRVPVLGHIPLLGLLFTSTATLDQQSSLFLFVTFEIVK